MLTRILILLFITQIKTQKPKIVIKCEENCEQFELTHRIVLSAICLENCKKISRKPYKWTIKPILPFDVEDNRIIFFPAAGQQLGGQKYGLKLKKDKAKAAFSFQVQSYCKMDREFGYTVGAFSLDCDYRPKASAKIFADIQGTWTRIYSGTVGSASGFKIRNEGYPINLKISVDSKEFLSAIYIRHQKPDYPEKILGTGNYSLTWFIDHEDFHGLTIIAKMLITELTKQEKKLRSHYVRHIAAAISDYAESIPDGDLFSVIPEIIHQNFTDPMILDFITESMSKKRNMPPKVLETFSTLLHGILDSNVENSSTLARTTDINHLSSAVGHLIDGMYNIKPAWESSLETENIKLVSTEIHFRENLTIPRTPAHNESYVSFTSELTRYFNFNNQRQCIVFSLRENPFWFHELGQRGNANPIIIEIFSNPQIIPIPMDIYLKNTKTDFKTIHGFLNTTFDELWRTYKLDVEKNSQINVTFEHNGADFNCLVSTEFPTRNQVGDKGSLVSTKFSTSIVIQNPEHRILYLSVARIRSEALNYTIHLQELRCLHWDSKKFSSSACRIGPNTSQTFTHCQCGHLSLFLSTYHLPEAKIVTFRYFLSDYVLQKTQWVIILLFWGLFFIYAIRRDMRDNFLQLADNVPGDSFPYLVCLRHSGTSARVVLQIIGTDSESRRHCVDGNRSDAWFVIFTERSLGIITSVAMHHDCYGRNPHWFCEKIEIRDLAQQRRYLFHPDRWLSLIHDDGKIQRVFDKETEKPTSLLMHNMKAEWVDSNLWVGIVTHPANSSVTTSERTVVAMSQVLVVLLSVTLLYGATDQFRLDEKGSFAFTHDEWLAVLITMILVILYEIGITVLFTQSAPTNLHRKRAGA